MRNNILNKKFKYTYSHVVYYLILLNCAVFALTQLFELRVRGVPLLYWMSLIPAFVRMGCVWQFVSYMFVHGSSMHLFFNMYALAIFGTLAERSIGSREFTLFYFLIGIVSGVLNYLYACFIGVGGFAIMGASGAIYAILFLIAVMYPYNRVLLFFFIPLKMPIAVLVFIVIEVVSQLTGTNADIAHLIHLAGIFLAWLYCLVRFRISPIKVWRKAL